MKKIYKVSLFDDSIPGKRTEKGLYTNDGFVFITKDFYKAEDAFYEELRYMKKHYKQCKLHKSVSVNICSTWGLLEDEECKWLWERQSIARFMP